MTTVSASSARSTGSAIADDGSAVTAIATDAAHATSGSIAAVATRGSDVSAVCSVYSGRADATCSAVTDESSTATVSASETIAAVAKKCRARATGTWGDSAGTMKCRVGVTDTKDRTSVWTFCSSVFDKCETSASRQLRLCSLFKNRDHFKGRIRLRDRLIIGLIG